MKRFLSLAALLLSSAALAQQPAPKDKPNTAQNPPVPTAPRKVIGPNQAPEKTTVTTDLQLKAPIHFEAASDVTELLTIQYGSEAGDEANAKFWGLDIIQAENNRRVDMDLDNVSLSDALKALRAAVKDETTQFRADKDVPEDTRATLRVKNVRLSTAMAALADSLDLHWRRERESVLDPKGLAKSKITYILCKANKHPSRLWLPQQLPIQWQSNQFFLEPNWNQPNQWYDFNLPNRELLHKQNQWFLPQYQNGVLFVSPTNPPPIPYNPVPAQPGIRYSLPQLQYNLNPIQPQPPYRVELAPGRNAAGQSTVNPWQGLQFNTNSSLTLNGNTMTLSKKPFNLSVNYDLSKQTYLDPKAQFTNSLKPLRLTYSFSTQEERATFTCPHCKRHVTLVGRPQATKPAKEGPTTRKGWKFCPFCGKPVS